MQWIDLACQHVQLQREGENEEKKERKKERKGFVNYYNIKMVQTHTLERP